MPSLTVDTPTGPFTLTETDDVLVRAEWLGAGGDETPLLREARRQLTAYWEKSLQDFDLPLRVEGSETLRLVCGEIAAIPYGETVTYGDISKRLGIPARAVGRACGANPLPILIPCHRVMGAAGLTGFSGLGGVETKVALLRHEGAAGLLI